MDANIKILVEALQMIQSYDHNGDGICPYGCDTPYIAKEALDKFDNAECSSRQVAEPDPEDLKDAERFQWLLQKGFAWNGCYNANWQPGEWLYGGLANPRLQVDEAMAWEHKAKNNP